MFRATVPVDGPVLAPGMHAGPSGAGGGLVPQPGESSDRYDPGSPLDGGCHGRNEEHWVIATVRWGSATHQGRVREHNEDAVLAGPTIFAVADGMGGHAGGEVASALAVAQLAELTPAGLAPEAVRDALARSNAAIISRGAEQGLPGMGTTVAGVAPLAEDRALIFSLGDSRVYRWRAGILAQLTEDDSLVAEMVRAGRLSAEAARTHPERNVITRALGVDGELEPHMFDVDCEPHDVFVIASDGLFNEVDDATIADTVGQAGSEDHRARLLMDRAIANGGRDNVSVILVTVTDGAESGDLSEDTNPHGPVPDPSTPDSTALARRSTSEPATGLDLPPVPSGDAGADGREPMADGAPSPEMPVWSDIPGPGSDSVASQPSATEDGPQTTAGLLIESVPWTPDTRGMHDAALGEGGGGKGTPASATTDGMARGNMIEAVPLLGEPVTNDD